MKFKGQPGSRSFFKLSSILSLGFFFSQAIISRFSTQRIIEEPLTRPAVILKCFGIHSDLMVDVCRRPTDVS
jgi:hypothetical protein